MKTGKWKTAVLGAVLFVLSTGTARATVCNMTLLTDNAPDYTDMQSLIWSATSNFATDKEKVLRLFRWAAQGRRQTEPGPEHGYEVRDPILFYNSYGNTLCSLISGMNIQVWQNMGYDGCRWDTSAHSLSQVYYGGAWHWLDNSLTAYFWNDGGEIASIAEVSEDNDPTLHICLSQYGSEIGSCYDGWAWCSDSPTQRTLRHFGDTYAKNAYIVEYHTEGEWGHRYTLNLRQFEHYTRYWAPCQPRTIDVYRPNNSGNDPDSQWNLYNIVGNGRWNWHAKQRAYCAIGSEPRGWWHSVHSLIRLGSTPDPMWIWLPGGFRPSSSSRLWPLSLLSVGISGCS